MAFVQNSGVNSALSYQELMNISSELKTCATSMDSLLNSDIKSLFDKIGTDGVWTGDAAEALKDQFTTLSGKFPEFISSLDDCSKYISEVVQSYQDVDKQLMQ